MQVKKYIANDMQEAVRMIKEDLGSRAVILSTRKVRKGSGAFGLFGKYVLEVTAAKDEEKQKPAPKNFDGLANRQTGYAQSSASEPPSPPEPKREPMRTAGPTAYAGLQEDISELKDL